jgi:hypothetical protein
MYVTNLSNYRAEMTLLNVEHFAGACPGMPRRLVVQSSPETPHSATQRRPPGMFTAHAL